MAAPRPTPDHVWTFLPGLHGTPGLFGKIRECIPAGQRCEWITLPTKGKQHYGHLADWLDGELETLEGKQRVLVAESFSGPLALRLASRRQGEVAAVVLAASFCDAPLNPGIALLPLRPLFMVKPPRKALEHFLIGPDAGDDDVALLTEAIQHIPSSTLSKRVRAVLELGPGESPPLKDVPMLILQARNDGLIPWEAQQRLEARYPGAQVHWIEAPHMVLQRQPAACVGSITAFLAALA